MAKIIEDFYDSFRNSSWIREQGGRRFLWLFVVLLFVSAAVYTIWPKKDYAQPIISLKTQDTSDYICYPTSLNNIGRAVLASEQQNTLPGEINPYCGNHYDRLIIAPNPQPEFSEATPSANGVFDDIAQLINQAENEVLISTMWYIADTNHDSPGFVIAQAIADKYQDVKNNPQKYPQGFTVRYLLGNPPEFTVVSIESQVWNLLRDIRDAGVDNMQDDELGWKLEVANYPGAWPHSHTKTIVVDGKTVMVVGFNQSYDHFPANHFSGKGLGRHDLGIQVTGPVAQEALAVFDDLWQGATQIICQNLHPFLESWWQLTCYSQVATTDHISQVLHFAQPTENTSNFFSMYRTHHNKQADNAVVAAIKAADSSLDIWQVNFTLEMLCDLNVLLEMCTVYDSPKYMRVLVETIQEKQIPVRILLEGKPIEGLENGVAVKQLTAELERLGVRDLVEFRRFDGMTHTKAVLIDKQFLIVGSQNFHYSAWGKLGLTEYNLGTDDDTAITDFQRMFEYYWEQGEVLR